MKTLLIPTLTLALTCLPALAQQIAAPTPPAPSGDSKPNEASSFTGVVNTPNLAEEADNARRAKWKREATPVLRKMVQIEGGATLIEAVSQLSQMLQDQGVDPLNVVVSSELEKVVMPAITLRNVSASDVLNVITKVTGLNVEPVLSDSGRVAAWIITPPGAVFSAQGGGSMGGGGLPGEGGAGEPAAPATADQPITPATPGIQSSGAGVGGSPAAGSGLLSRVPVMGRLFATPGAPTAGAGGGEIASTWIDPAAPTPAPAQINRVLGVARIYADVTNDNERVEKEAMLVKMLREMTEVQKLKCDVRLYGELHVLVVKGSPEAVELVEQTISALKENAGAKKGEGGSKFSSGAGTKF